MMACEMPMKQWVAEVAEAEGGMPHAIAMRLSRGKNPNYFGRGAMPYPEVRRVNARVVMVQVGQQQDWREELNA